MKFAITRSCIISDICPSHRTKKPKKSPPSAVHRLFSRRDAFSSAPSRYPRECTWRGDLINGLGSSRHASGACLFLVSYHMLVICDKSTLIRELFFKASNRGSHRFLRSREDEIWRAKIVVEFRSIISNFSNYKIFF